MHDLLAQEKCRWAFQAQSRASSCESSFIFMICFWGSRGATAGTGVSTEPNRKFVAYGPRPPRWLIVYHAVSCIKSQGVVNLNVTVERLDGPTSRTRARGVQKNYDPQPCSSVFYSVFYVVASMTTLTIHNWQYSYCDLWPIELYSLSLWQTVHW